jgi:hypothetical protein
MKAKAAKQNVGTEEVWQCCGQFFGGQNHRMFLRKVRGGHYQLLHRTNELPERVIGLFDQAEAELLSPPTCSPAARLSDPGFSTPSGFVLMGGAPIEAMVAYVSACLDLSSCGWSKESQVNTHYSRI